MKSPLLYLLEVLFCSGILLAFYRLLLVRKVAYAHCRRYLVAAVVLSAAIPALDIPVYPARTVVYPLPLIAAAPELPAAGFAALEEFPAGTSAPIPVAEAPAARVVDWPHIARLAVTGLYVATAALLLVLFTLRIAAIRRLRRRSRLTDCGEYTLAEHTRIETPFSFLRTVFIGSDCDPECRRIVLSHEASHVRHRHSAERIAVELFRCLFWFNPFVWMAGRWLQEVQEWEADRDVLDEGYDLTEYRTIVFRQLFGYNPDIACGLNHSFTKNRFAMMTQFKCRRFAFMRFGAAIPVVAGMMMLCSFTTRTAGTADTVDTTKISRIHIAADGSITLNGRSVSIDELTHIVEQQRKELSELPDTPLQFSFEGPVGRVDAPDAPISFGSAGSLEVLHADRVYELEDKMIIYGGNVRALFRDNSSEPALSDPLTRVRCDSLVAFPAGRYLECIGNYIFLNEKRLYVGDMIRLSVNDSGFWNQEMRNTISTWADEALIQIEEDGKIRLNGEPVEVGELASRLKAWRAGVTEVEGAWIYALNGVNMERINAIKEALREAAILRVRYTGSLTTLVRMLPPLSNADSHVNALSGPLTVVAGDAKLTPVAPEGLQVRERNYFPVRILGAGEIEGGQAKQYGPLELYTLKDRIREFVLNAGDDPGMPEKEICEFDLPDGGRMSYPVSRGIVGLQVAPEVTFARYLEVQSQLDKAYKEIREELSQRQFGKWFSDLSEPEQAVIYKAVPMRIHEQVSSGSPR